MHSNMSMIFDRFSISQIFDSCSLIMHTRWLLINYVCFLWFERMKPKYYDKFIEHYYTVLYQPLCILCAISQIYRAICVAKVHFVMKMYDIFILCLILILASLCFGLSIINHADTVNMYNSGLSIYYRLFNSVYSK